MIVYVAMKSILATLVHSMQVFPDVSNGDLGVMHSFILFQIFFLTLILLLIDMMIQCGHHNYRNMGVRSFAGWRSKAGERGLSAFDCW